MQKFKSIKFIDAMKAYQDEKNVFVIIPLEGYEPLGDLVNMNFVMEEEIEPKKIEKNPAIKVAQQAAESKQAAKSRKVDKGKINALYKAGWQINDIADELKCTAQTVRNNLEV